MLSKFVKKNKKDVEAKGWSLCIYRLKQVSCFENLVTNVKLVLVVRKQNKGAKYRTEKMIGQW